MYRVNRANLENSKPIWTDLPDNTEIDCGNKKYKIKEGKILLFDSDNTRGKEVDEMILSDEQISLFMALRKRDNFTDLLSTDDIEDLNKSGFKGVLKDVYGDTIKINSAKIDDNSFYMEIEPEYDNGFEKFWKKFRNIFRKKDNKLPILTRKETTTLKITMESQKPSLGQRIGKAWHNLWNKDDKKVLEYTSRSFTHKISSDITPDSLSKNYDIPLESILDLNPELYTVEELKPNQKIRVPKPVKTKKYKIKKDDTLEAIAKKYNLLPGEIRAVNPDIDFDNLQPKTKIKIPKERQYTSYRVKVNETFSSIAEKHGITKTELINANAELRVPVNTIPKNTKVTLPEANHLTVVTEENVQVVPERIYVASKKIEAQTLANDYDMSFAHLMAANPNLKAIQEGDTVILPEHKKVLKVEEPTITAIAKETGVSEVYIRDILFGFEGKNMEPDLDAYDDDVAPPKSDFDVMLEKNFGAKYRAKNQQINAERAKKKLKPEPLWVTIRRGEGYAVGTPTIGFGHTGRVHGVHMGRNTKEWKDVKITREEAFQILAQDILLAKQDCIDYFGEDFEQAPQSIQDALVDIVFNKGLDGFERADSPSLNIKDALKKKDYVTVASSVIVDPTNPGLRRRNIYRVLVATIDLSKEERNEVLKNVEAYKNTTKNKLGKNLGNELERHYRLAQDKDIRHGFFNG